MTERKIEELFIKQINFDNINVKFKKDKRGNLKLSIQGLRKSCRNPILAWALHSSVFARISSQISTDEIEKLHILSEKAKEEFEEEFYEIVLNKITAQLEDKLKSRDLPTPIFPTSVAQSEIPNYYIYEPKEMYTLETKIELFNKLADSICGRCGQRLYGLYVPEGTDEGVSTKSVLKGYKNPDELIDILRIARVGRINLREIGPFEYVFYLLDKVLQEMFRRNRIPSYHVELFVIEGVGGRKKFFSHYIIPNLNEIFSKLYHGDKKYWISTSGRATSKIKALISSFLVENWNIDNNLKKNNSEIAHAHIDRFLYYILCHRRLDLESILFLEDLKIKLGDSTPILFLEEVISWM